VTSPTQKISTWQHTTLTRDRFRAAGGTGNQNPNKRAAADPRFRPHGYWDPLNTLRISTWQHTTLTRDRFRAAGGTGNQNPNKRAAADPRFRPHGYWDPLNTLRERKQEHVIYLKRLLAFKVI